jgi:hypothetical protein
MDLSEHDPALVAAISARTTAEQAHHEAGHAVAAVARDGLLESITLGTADYSVFDESTATDGVTDHLTHPKNVPFCSRADCRSSTDCPEVNPARCPGTGLSE